MTFLLFLIVFSLTLFTCILSTLVFQLISLLGCIIVISLASWQLSLSIRWSFMSNEKLCSKRRSVLITGCDSGFGFETAIQLQSSGWQVFATVLCQNGRNADQLKALGCIVIPMDVTINGDVDATFNRVVDECRKRDLELWALVNNAGVISCGEVEWGTLDRQLEQLINVNVVGCVRTTRRFLPLIKHADGRIINMSSVAGIFTAPGVVFYSMTKHAVTSFTDGLRRELKNSKVDIIEIVPDAYKTSMTSRIMIDNLDKCWQQTSNEVQNQTGNDYYQSFRSYIQHNLEVSRDKPQEVVDAIVKAVTLKHVKYKYICCGYINYLIIWSFFWLPLELLEPIVSLFTVQDKPAWIAPKQNIVVS